MNDHAHSRTCAADTQCCYYARLMLRGEVFFSPSRSLTHLNTPHTHGALPMCECVSVVLYIYCMYRWGGGRNRFSVFLFSLCILFSVALKVLYK